MKKVRLIAAVMVGVMACANTIAIFAHNEYIKNFSKIKDYQTGQFSDINSEWFSQSVQDVYEVGLMVGNSETTFNPNGNLTNAEAIAIAARLHSVYSIGEENFKRDGSIWYQPYLDYAIEKNICSNNFSPLDTANRAFFIGILGNAVDNNVLSQKNNIDDGDLYDVEQDWYSDSIYSFYRSGILGGNDEYGTFAPDKPITRAEVAAILVRIVKPSKRIEVALKEKPKSGTYSIMEDDGSLKAFQQRALAANFEVILGEKAKDENWQSDIYTIEHSQIKGIPSETIVIPRKYIDSRYDESWREVCIAFKGLHVNSQLTGEYVIPIRYIKYGLPWRINGKEYYLSVVNTGGKVDFYGDMVIQGDLQLYYPGTPDTDSWTSTYTYDNYTNEAYSMIDAAYNRPEPDEVKVKEYINQNLEDLVNTVSASGKKLSYDIKNIYNMYKYNIEQSDTGKYIINVTVDGLGKSLLKADIVNYNPDELPSVKSWHYDGTYLMVNWKIQDIKFANAVVISSNELIRAWDKDISGLLRADEHSLSTVHPSSYAGRYSIDYSDQTDDFSEMYFYMNVDGDEIKIWRATTPILSSGIAPKEQTIVLTSHSDEAFIDGKTVKVSPEPKIIDGDVYLPPEFIITNLFKTEINNTALDLSGYAKLVQEEYNGLYHLDCDEHKDKSFYVKGASSGYIEYDYKIYKSMYGPTIEIALDSETAAIWEEKTGYYTVKIPKAQKVHGEVYLPVAFIINTLFENN